MAVLIAKSWHRFAALVLVCLFASGVFAAGPSKSKKEGVAENAAAAEPEESKVDPTLYVQEKPKVLTDKEMAAICERLKNQYIEYYSDVFLVKKVGNKCVRSLVDVPDVYRLNQRGIKVKEVGGDEIQALMLEKEEMQAKINPKDVCRQYEGKYITLFPESVYLVQKCKKRLFPDGPSLEAYRHKLKISNQPEPISERKFFALEEGEPMPSAVYEEFKDLLEADNVDVIPINKACAAVVGRVTTYLNDIFLIRKVKTADGTLACEKVRLDGEEYTKKNSLAQAIELSSSQAISIPDAMEAPAEPKKVKK